MGSKLTALAFVCNVSAERSTFGNLQCNIDIFFVDWDRPRWADMPSEKGVGKKDHPKISCWRTLFVANEWNELQVRQVSAPATWVDGGKNAAHGA